MNLDTAQVELQLDKQPKKGRQRAAARPKRTNPAAAQPPVLELELPGKALRATVFRKVDTHAKGTLSADEARAAVAEIWPSFNLQSAFMLAYQSVVQDTKSGRIGRKDFRRMLKYIVYFNTHWAVFEDVSQKSKAPGFLSGDEFRTAARRLGLKGTRARPIAHQFIALATTRMDARDAKVGFEAFCRWCAEQQVTDDPEEMDAAKATSSSHSQQTPQRSGQPAQSGGGWGRAPPRFPTKPSRTDVLNALKQEQRPRLKKGGGVPTAQTGYAYVNPSTPTKPTPAKAAASPRTGRTRTPERAAPSPSRRGYWLYNSTGHK
jgi:hypothetical protein